MDYKPKGGIMGKENTVEDVRKLILEKIIMKGYGVRSYSKHIEPQTIQEWTGIEHQLYDDVFVFSATIEYIFAGL